MNKEKPLFPPDPPNPDEKFCRILYVTRKKPITVKNRKPIENKLIVVLSVATLLYRSGLEFSVFECLTYTGPLLSFRRSAHFLLAGTVGVI